LPIARTAEIVAEFETMVERSRPNMAIR